MKTCAMAFMLLVMAGVSGCQCCGPYEHYAGLIDSISDHEHTYERFYSPGWDLNRIGRPDWCSYPKNQWLCGCACNRCKPAPCGHVVCRTRLLTDGQVSQPDWTGETLEEATDSPEIEKAKDALDNVPTPPAPEFPTP